MTRIVVIHASRHGQTATIAGYLAGRLRGRGRDACAWSVHAVPPGFALDSAAAVVIAAPVYAGRFPRSVDTFVRAHATALMAHPRSAWLTVSLGWAGERDGGAIRQLTGDWLATLGWSPARIEYAAGAVAYPRYNPLVRWIVRRIVARAGGDTDTAREFEYTDWDALDGFADWLADTSDAAGQSSA